MLTKDSKGKWETRCDGCGFVIRSRGLVGKIVVTGEMTWVFCTTCHSIVKVVVVPPAFRCHATECEAQS